MWIWLFHLIRIKIYNREVTLTLLLWLDFSTRQTRSALNVRIGNRLTFVAVSCQFAVPSTTSCNLTFPVQHETCEQSSGNWNSCWLPLGSCLRTPSFPTHALGLCYFHNMTSQSVVCPHVSQNYCQGLKTESVRSTKTAAMSQRGLLHSIILHWLPLQVTSSVHLME